MESGRIPNFFNTDDDDLDDDDPHVRTFRSCFSSPVTWIPFRQMMRNPRQEIPTNAEQPIGMVSSSGSIMGFNNNSALPMSDAQMNLLQSIRL